MNLIRFSQINKIKTFNMKYVYIDQKPMESVYIFKDSVLSISKSRRELIK